MRKIVVLQGPPVYGKSVWAKEFNTDSGWTIVSRDYIVTDQQTLDERHDFECLCNDVAKALKDGKNVIASAMNLGEENMTKWRNFAEEHNAELSFKEFYLPFAEAVEQDRKSGKVGGGAIGKAEMKRVYRTYYNDRLIKEQIMTVKPFRVPQDRTLPPAVICDLDSTLAWKQSRSIHDYTRVDEDEYDPNLAQLLTALMHDGIFVIFISGREGNEDCIKKTTEWIESHLDDYLVHKMDGEYKLYELHTRASGDYRDDAIVKKEIYDDCVKGRWNVLCAFEDRNEVVKMWRELGLLCCQVAEGNF